ncbi:MAG: TRAP transporter small permease [Alphaproteobacteria bacterium]|nr:TRAP transporter small permease [Alphaproteobacteria bacterium]
MSPSDDLTALPHRRNRFLWAVGAISTLCGWFAAGLIVLSVAITCQMIYVRAILNQSTIWQTEAVIYMMIAATLLGLPYVQRLRGHVNVDLLPMALPPGPRKALILTTLAVSIAVIAVMLFYGFNQWYEAWSRNWRSDTVWGVRLWIPYLAIPIGFGLFLLQLIADFYAVAVDLEKNYGVLEH